MYSQFDLWEIPASKFTPELVQTDPSSQIDFFQPFRVIMQAVHKFFVWSFVWGFIAVIHLKKKLFFKKKGDKNFWKNWRLFTWIIFLLRCDFRTWHDPILKLHAVRKTIGSSRSRRNFDAKSEKANNQLVTSPINSYPSKINKEKAEVENSYVK